MLPRPFIPRPFCVHSRGARADLDKHHAIHGHDHDNHDHDSDFSIAEALGSPKFWALVLAAISYFLFGGALNLHLPTMLVLEAV